MALTNRVSPASAQTVLTGPAAAGEVERLWRLTTFQTIAVGVLVLVAPVLALPEFVPLVMRAHVVLPLAVGALALACVLAARAGNFAVAVCLFAVAAGMGWLRTPNAQQDAVLATGLARDALQYDVTINLRVEALQHLSGIALGLLTMTVVLVFATTRERLLVVVALFAVASIGVVATGLAGTSRDFLAREYAKFFVPEFADALPHVQLGLPIASYGGWINPNALGATALMVVPVNLALAVVPVSRVWWTTPLRVVGWLAAALAAFVVVLTQSRSVWLAALIVLVVWLVWRGHRRWIRIAALVVSALLVVVVAAWLSGQSVQLGQVLLAAGESAAFRLRIWRFAIDRLAEAPFAGMGLNQLHVIDPVPPLEHMPLIVAHAHNAPLQVALDLGLVGLAVYVVMIGWLLARAVQAARGPSAAPATLALGAALSLVAVHAFGIGDTVALGARVGVFQWLASGIVLAAWQLQCPGRQTRSS